MRLMSGMIFQKMKNNKNYYIFDDEDDELVLEEIDFSEKRDTADPDEPLNNDGRFPNPCYWCGGKLKRISTGWNWMDICEECGR